MADPQPSASSPVERAPSQVDAADRDQMAERLRWTPKQRLAYLADMIAFEERARRARRRLG
jgi:hypothetical protein